MTQTTEQTDPDEAYSRPLPTGVESLIVRTLDRIGGVCEPEQQVEPVRVFFEAGLVRTAALERGLRVDVLSDDLQILHNQTKAIGFYRSASSDLTLLDRAIARDRSVTRRLLASHDVPVAPGSSAASMQEALRIYRDIADPVIVKPRLVRGGRRWGAVDTEEELQRAVGATMRRNGLVLVEQMLPGFNIRITVIGGQAISAMLRVPANVVGDGRRTVQQLVQDKNAHRARNPYLHAYPITITARTNETLALTDSNLDTVPEAGVRVFLSRVQKLSAGGDTYEVIHHVHTAILELAEQAAAAFRSSKHTRVDLLVERHDMHPAHQRCVVDSVQVGTFPAIDRPTKTGPALVDASIRSADGLARSHRIGSRPLRRKRWRIRPVKDGQPPTSLITDLGRQAEPHRDELSGLRPISARALDHHFLRQALHQLGCAHTEFAGRLIRTVSEGTERLLERTSGTLFVRELAKDPSALHHVTHRLGVATVDHAVLGADDLLEAERLVSDAPGRWRLRIDTASGKPRRAVHVTSVSRLERKWRNLPLSTRQVIMERIPETATCVVLVLAGKAVATILREPFTIVGDGQRNVATLIQDKLSIRETNPYLSSLPVRESLLDATALARRDLEPTQVPEPRSTHRLARSPEHRLGVDTYGLGPSAYPKLGKVAERMVGAIGNPMIVSVSFAMATEHGSTDQSTPWALWGVDPDPVLSEFALPWAGHSASVFEPAARSLLESGGYSVTSVR